MANPDAAADKNAVNEGVIPAAASRVASAPFVRLVAEQQKELYDGPYDELYRRVVRRRDVDLVGDRRSGGGLAGRRDFQAVEKIIGCSRSACEVIVKNRKETHTGKITTDKTVSETASDLQNAFMDNHFGVMQIHNLKETMAKKGVDFARECLIFEVCQPQQAKKVLYENMSISTALPCRISIYEECGKTFLATLKPTSLLAMFNVTQLEGVAQEVEATIFKIMKEAVSG